MIQSHRLQASFGRTVSITLNAVLMISSCSEMLSPSGFKLAGVIPRWVLFIVDYHPVSGKQKQSLQRQENWQYCSTMPLNMVRNMSILARIIMKSATVIAYSTGLNEGQNHWVTLSSKILSYVCEPGVSQEGYRALDVRLPEQFSIIGKLVSVKRTPY